MNSVRAGCLPDYKVRTPLQHSIMILKRHRDMMFARDEINCCPISIIITTLAAHAYGGQDDVGEALFAILAGMERHILRDSYRASAFPWTIGSIISFSGRFLDI